MLNSRDKGIIGEKTAAEYLIKKGYVIISRNFRSKWGEIDIIAEKTDILSFIEVKNWGSYSISELEYAINKKKRDRIIKTARVFLNCNPKYYLKKPAFDVIYLNNNEEIKHIIRAFSGDEI